MEEDKDPLFLVALEELEEVLVEKVMKTLL
jgi:hypothetical protein